MITSLFGYDLYHPG